MSNVCVRGNRRGNESIDMQKKMNYEKVQQNNLLEK